MLISFSYYKGAWLEERSDESLHSLLMKYQGRIVHSSHYNNNNNNVPSMYIYIFIENVIYTRMA